MGSLRLALKQFLSAYNIKAPALNSPDPELRVSILLSFIGLRLLAVIEIICAPAALGTNNFHQLLERLNKQFGKAPSKSLARQKFIKAKKRDSETVEQYGARLRVLFIDSDYGGSL